MSQKRKKFVQLEKNKRNELYRHYSDGKAVKEIAQELGVHRSSIYRELNRNKHPDHRCYLPDTAQRLSLERRNRPGTKIMRSKHLQQIIRDGVAMPLSPEVIAGRLKREQSEHKISHESIYKWIYNEGKEHKLHKKLLRRKRKRGIRPCKKAKKSKIPNRISIHERPKRPPDEMGNWEADTVHFSKGSESIITLYDKATKVTMGAKMTSRTTEETLANMLAILGRMPKELRRSVTLDNGSEFTNHEQLTKELSVRTYFCDSYSSWQKGGVENANGILRRYIPKGSKADQYSAKRVQDIFYQINTTPRKSLGYKTPYEALLTRITGKDRIIPLFLTHVALRL